LATAELQHSADLEQQEQILRESFDQERFELQQQLQALQQQLQELQQQKIETCGIPLEQLESSGEQETQVLQQQALVLQQALQALQQQLTTQEVLASSKQREVVAAEARVEEVEEEKLEINFLLEQYKQKEKVREKEKILGGEGGSEEQVLLPIQVVECVPVRM